MIEKNYLEVDFIYVCYKSYNEIRVSIKSLINLIKLSDIKANIYIADNSFSETKNSEINKLINTKINIIDKNKVDIIYIPIIKNVGFGKACNIASKVSRAESIIFLNPDVNFNISNVENLKSMLNILNQKEVGIIGPSCFDKNHQAVKSYFRFNRSSILTKPLQTLKTIGGISKYLAQIKFLKRQMQNLYYKDNELKDINYVDWLQGCFLVISRTFFQELGGFDERYFLYFEDTDLCRKTKKLKKKVILYNKFKIIHYGNFESKKSKGLINSLLSNKASRYHLISWIKYCIKWRNDLFLGINNNL